MARQLEQTDPKVILATESFMPNLVKLVKLPLKSEEIYLFDGCFHGSASHWTKLVVNEQMAQDLGQFQSSERGNEDRLSHLLFRQHWGSPKEWRCHTIN